MAKRTGTMDDLAAKVAMSVGNGTGTSTMNGALVDAGTLNPSTTAALNSLPVDESILSDVPNPPVSEIIPPVPPAAPPAPFGTLTAAAAAAPAPAPPSPSIADMSPDQLAATLSSLPPEKLALIRLHAAKAGITSGPKKSTNGNILMEIEINVDLVEPIRSWAEQSGLTFEGQVQQLVDYLLPGFLIGGMGTPEIAAPAAAATTT